MKKRIVCLTLALMMSAMQVVSVSASREDELREEQAITSQQLDATYSSMDEQMRKHSLRVKSLNWIPAL